MEKSLKPHPSNPSCDTFISFYYGKEEWGLLDNGKQKKENVILLK